MDPRERSGLPNDTPDLVMALSPSGVSLLDQLVADDLYVPLEFARVALGEGGSFNVLHPATGGKVDVFVCAASDRSEIQRRGCVEMAAIHQLDRTYLDRWAGALGVADDLAALLTLVDERR